MCGSEQSLYFVRVLVSKRVFAPLWKVVALTVIDWEGS